MDVAKLRTNEQWATAYLQINKNFCPGPVELVTSNAYSSTYVGIATPAAISASSFYAHITIFPRVLVVFTTWAILCSLIVVMGYPFAAHWKADAGPSGFTALGIIGMVLFIVFHFAPIAGKAAVWVLVGGALFALIMIWRRDKPGLELIIRRGGSAALIWLAVSIAYAAFISAADNGGGSWAVNALFTPLRWSSDNQLPFDFAEALYTGVPREKIVWGAWLASDRPPLLAALLLIPRSTVIPLIAAGIGVDMVPISYQLAAITTLASWAGAIHYFCLRFGRRHAGAVIFLAFCTSFFLFNTVYIWPKILGGTYVLIAFGLLVRMREGQATDWVDLATIALCASLSYLSHGSSVFALVPLAAVFSGAIVRRRPAEIGVACTAALLCTAPWLWWQAAVQPGGNALVRYALTNDLYSFQHRSDSLMSSVLHTYSNLGIAGWISAKVRGLALMLGLTTNWRSFGEVAQFSPANYVPGAWRVLDFFLPSRSLGVATLGLALLAIRVLLGSRSNRGEQIMRLAALVGLAGVLLAFAVMLATPITHVQAYGARLLCFLAGAFSLTGYNTYVRVSAITVAFTYFAIVWIGGPLLAALRVEASALVLFLLSVITLAALASRPQRGRVR